MGRAGRFALASAVGLALGVQVLGAAATPGSAGAAEFPRLNGFEITRHRVAREEILQGGPPRDAVRSVDRPRFETAAEASWLDDHVAVLGVSHRGEAHAYPVYFLEWHLVVNDTLGGDPVLVTFDALTGAPRAYRRTVRGNVLDFGVSGLIYNSGSLLYDRASESLWSQFRGDAIAGRFSGEGLEALEVRQESFAMWRKRHPDTKVLLAPEDVRIAYMPGGGPYEPYYQVDKAPFPVHGEDQRFHAKEMVLGVVVDGRPRAYIGSIVARDGGSLVDKMGGRSIRVEFLPRERVFRYDTPEDVEVTEAFWFAWKAWHPDTEIWNDPGRVPGRSR